MCLLRIRRPTFRRFLREQMMHAAMRGPFNASEDAGSSQVRERLASIATGLMDPIGFTLENFDAIALWRTQDAGEAIVGKEELYDGTIVEGPAGLRKWLLGYSDQFVRVTAEKMLTYALGRRLEPEDMPLVRKDRTGRRAEQQQILRTGSRHRAERCVSEEYVAQANGHSNVNRRQGGQLVMFVTKRHLPRRTFLKGAGVTLALPLLEAMIPASTALAQTAAAPPPRFMGIFFPHGLSYSYWEMPRGTICATSCRTSWSR